MSKYFKYIYLFYFLKNVYMTLREDFNKLYKQEPDTSNSLEKISNLTGIKIEKLRDVYLKSIREFRYYGIPYKRDLSKEHYAYTKVYLYALQHLRLDGRIKRKINNLVIYNGEY